MGHHHTFTAERIPLADQLRASIEFVDAQQACPACTPADYCAEHYAEQQAFHFGFSSVAEFRAECLRLSLINLAANDEPEPDEDDEDEEPWPDFDGDDSQWRMSPYAFDRGMDEGTGL